MKPTNQTRIELVVQFGKRFDALVAQRDENGMMTLAAWAKLNRLPDCGRQAYRAAEALANGDAVKVRTAAMVIGNGGSYGR